MTRAQTITLILVAIVLVVGSVGLFLVYFEQVEEEITTDYSLKARHNPFLAAERFIEKLGNHVSSSRERDKLEQALLGDDISVIITGYSHTLEKPERRERLLNWIRRGGHLVLEVKVNSNLEDVVSQRPFLDEFGVTPVSKNLFLEDYEEQQTQVQIYQDGAVFQASFLPRYSLEVSGDKAHLLAGDDNGTHLAEFEVGEGLVTLLSDMDVWRNAAIGELDHAALLAEVLGKSPGQIWILHYIHMPSLFEIIWRDAKWVVVPLLAFLLFFLWSLNNRFGPFAIFVKRQRRSLLEHIEAAGHFDWRFNQGVTLLAGVRGDLFQYIESRHPNWEGKGDTEKLNWIAEKTKIPEAQVNHALHGNCQNHTAFLHAISTLQTIRKLL
ncbi:DUF4350 domain-containing protein [Kaarinaea lacus]